MKETFWTLGRYDVGAIVEAPHEMTMTALGLSLGALGNVPHANPPRILGSGDTDYSPQDGLTARFLAPARAVETG